MNTGTMLQLIWIFLGFGLQVWIGGIKGFVVFLVVAVILFINSMRLSVKEGE